MDSTNILGRLMETRAVLLDLRRDLRGIAADIERWYALAKDGDITTAADRALWDREERIASQAVYALWEGTPYDVRLEDSYDPWRVVLIADGETAGAGSSHGCASEALAEAIDSALETIKAHVREEAQP